MVGRICLKASVCAVAVTTMMGVSVTFAADQTLSGASSSAITAGSALSVPASSSNGASAASAPTTAPAPAVPTPTLRPQLILHGLAAVVAGQVNTGPYGAPLIAGCAWATWVTNCQNLTAYGNGSSWSDTGCGAPNGCKFGLEFQCNELAQRYAYYAWGEPAQWDGYGGANGSAASMWQAGPALPVPLQQFPNGGGVLPQQGDLIVFGPGWLGSFWDGDGHVAIVRDVGPTYVDIVEQNGSPTGTDRLQLSGTTVTGNGYTPTLGWLRHVVSAQPVRVTTATLSGAPQAVSPSPGVVDVFWRSPSNQLTWLSQTGRSVSLPWFNSNPSNMASDPSVVAAGGGGVAVFWEGTNGHLWFESSANDYAAQDLGDGPLGSPPLAVNNGSGGVEVFWRGSDGNLWSDTLAGNLRTGPRLLGDGPLASAPHPVTFGTNEVAVFWRGSDSNVWWDQNTGSGWVGAHVAAIGPLQSDPHPASAQPGTIQLVWQGTDTRVWSASFSGGSWVGNTAISTTGVASTPTLLSTPSGAVSAFLRENSGSLGMCTYAPSVGWLVPVMMGDGPLGSDPTAAVDSTQQRIDIFWRGSDGGLWSTTV
jgi:hypothetical protein